MREFRRSFDTFLNRWIRIFDEMEKLCEEEVVKENKRYYDAHQEEWVNLATQRTIELLAACEAYQCLIKERSELSYSASDIEWMKKLAKIDTRMFELERGLFLESYKKVIDSLPVPQGPNPELLLNNAMFNVLFDDACSEVDRLSPEIDRLVWQYYEELRESQKNKRWIQKYKRRMRKNNKKRIPKSKDK